MGEKVYIDVEVDDNGTTRKVGVDAKKLNKQLGNTTKSVHSADRAMKGASKQSSNTTKNFSKMSQGLTGGLVPAYATLAANIFAVSAAFNFLKRASDFSVLLRAQESYAANTGMALRSVTNALQEASGGMLKFQEAAQAAAIGMAKGFSPKQLSDLALGARKAAAALGRNFEDAFDRLIRGTSKAEPELLDELGITLRLETATQRYGDAIGKAANELTVFEKSQAVLVETQRQLNENFSEVEAAVNPFQKLANTFDRIVKRGTQFILPFFESFANIINNSATAAIAIFGALGVSILKTIVPIDEIKRGFSEFSEKQAAALELAEQNIKKYRRQVERTKETVKEMVETARIESSLQAEGLLRGGSKSKILQKIDRGDALSALDKANLRKAFASAEAQYKKHGEIRRGIFKKADIATVRGFKNSLQQMEKTSLTTSQKISNYWKGLGARMRLEVTKTRVSFVNNMQRMARAAALAGRAMNLALRFAGVVGTVVIIVNILKELEKSIFDFTYSALSFIDKIVNAAYNGLRNIFGRIVRWMGGLLADFGSSLPDKIGDPLEEAGLRMQFMGRMTVETEKNISDLAGVLERSEFGGFLKYLQETAKEGEKLNETIKNIKSSIDALSDDLGAQKATDPMSSLNLLGTAGVSGILTQIAGLRAKRPEEAAKLLESVLVPLRKVGKEVPQIAQALASGEGLDSLIPAFEKAELRARAATGNISAFTDSLETLEQGFRGAANEDFIGLSVALKASGRLATESEESARLAGKTVNIFERLNKAAGGNYQETLNYVETLIDRQQSLKLLEMDRQNRESQAFRSGSIIASRSMEQLDLEKRILEIKNLQNKADGLALSIENANANQKPALQMELERTEKQLQIRKQQLREKEKDLTDIGRIRQTAVDNLQTGLAGAFDQIITGTKSVKEAFRSMAVGVLEELSKIIAKMLVVKLIESSIGFLGGGVSQFGPQPQAATGGFKYRGASSLGFASGGIASGPSSGYPVTLHGTEAIVPLDNNKSIPVEFPRGMSGGGNNINVYVDVSNDGQTTERTEGDMSGLGTAIAKAVQKEIQNQKRPGGSLSPYGVS